MDTSASITMHDPRTGNVLYTVQEPTREEVDRVYDVAYATAEKLRAMSVRERVAQLKLLRRYLTEHKDEVAQRIVAETGKSQMDALILDIFPVLDAMAYYEKNAERILADREIKTPIMQMGKSSRIFYEPLGPVLMISPWNYPFNLSVLPFICAFMAGNPVILKPSSYTLLKGLLEDIIAGSGFMSDALQVVYASRRTAGYLIEKKPAKIHFTGSTGVGRKIMQQAAAQLVPVELELGGKDPLIVFEDVDLERTIDGALWGAFCNCGQTCTSVERIFVQVGVYDAFVQRLCEKAQKITTLDDPRAQQDELHLTMGCMTTEFQIREIEAQLEEAVAQGAKILTGGVRQPDSHIFPPTIVTNVTPAMRIQSEETFGPIVTVTPFNSEEEAIALANDSCFGLSSSVWSNDTARAERVARALHAGSVSINNVMATHGNPALPFGGVKDSGFGRYKGEEGLYAFSNIKAVLIDKPRKNPEAYWYPYSPKKYRLLSRVMDRVFEGGWKNLIHVALLGLRLDRLARRKRL